MKVRDLGEFELINKIAKQVATQQRLIGIGDDCAVFPLGNTLCCVSTDTLVENVHFKLSYFSAHDLGIKAIESSVSDIAAMGGKPLHVFISLTIPPSLEVKFVDQLYQSMQHVCKKYHMSILGGDTTSGKEMSITLTIIGTVAPENMCRRSDAQPGDFLMLSGDLGKSRAGLELLKHGLNGKSIQSHLRPTARVDFAKKYSKYIHAMIDISDGLAGDLQHICKQSNVGAILFKDNIPLSDKTRHVAMKFHHNPLNYALSGGEDYELLFTVPEQNLAKVPGFLIGEITKKKSIQLYSQGKLTLLRRSGYEHFH